MKIAPISLKNNSQNYIAPNFKKSFKALCQPTLKKTVLIPTVAFLAMFSTQSVKAQSEENTANIETVQYSEDIKLFGKDYTMFYMDNGFSNVLDSKAVSDIYFVPKNERGRTLKLEHLYHQKDSESETIIALVSDCNQPNTPQQASQEIKLPLELGKTLLDLYQGKSEFFLIPGSNTYSEK